MTENKRFTLQESGIYIRNDVICDKGIELPQSTACDLLNGLYEENNELKNLLKDMANKNGEIWLANGITYNLKKIFNGWFLE